MILKRENTSLRRNVDFAVGGPTIPTRWELLKEWNDGKISKWNLRITKDLYKKVKETMTMVKGPSCL